MVLVILCYKGVSRAAASYPWFMECQNQPRIDGSAYVRTFPTSKHECNLHHWGSSCRASWKSMPICNAINRWWRTENSLIGTFIFTSAPMSVRGPRKGENYELSVDLNSQYRDKCKDAIKRTIASMTVGKGIAYTLVRPIHPLNLDRRQRTLP